MRARTTPSGIEPGTFAAVIREFERSADFTSNQLSTQANWQHILRWAETVLGHLSVTDPDRGIRPAVVQAALDGLADRPGAQQNARTVLCKIDKWAVVREKLCRSITFGTTVIGSDGGHVPWTDPQVAYGEQNARPDISWAILLMAHTGQRGSDIVRMRLTDIEEQRHPMSGRWYPGINVIQQKTGLRLWVPFDDELRVRKREIGPPWLLVTNIDGQPYTRTRLTDTFRRQCRLPALELIKTAGLVLHGLRGTRVVRYRKLGATSLQISSMIGMSEEMVAHYCRLADRTDLSVAAVHHLGTIGAAGTIGERKNTAGNDNAS